MNTLVLGGNRFVGLEIVRRLRLAGHDVTVLALDPLPEEIAPLVTWLKVNRTDVDALQKAFGNAEFDVVVDNIAFERMHVEKLAGVLKGRVGRYVLTSSVDIYGQRAPQGFREDQAPLVPDDVDGIDGHERYMRGKRGAENALKESGIPWTVLRPCLVTGRTDNVTPPPVTRQLTQYEESGRSLFFPPRVLDGGPILMRHDDQGVFRLVHVQDVARAVLHVIGHGRTIGQAFNVAGDEIWTSDRLVRALAAAAGRDVEIVRVSPHALQAAGLGDYDPAYGRGPVWSVAEPFKLESFGWTPTPAETWLPKLLEISPKTGHRPGYERRMAEIALARHLQRRKVDAPLLPRAWKPPPGARPRAPDVVRFGAASDALRVAANVDPSHFKAFGEGVVSSIGVGTWMGEATADVDAMYLEALGAALEGGLNVVDAAINYRGMKAERVVGAALKEAQKKGISRESVLVCTKGGFIAGDADDPRPQARFVDDEYVRTGLVTKAEATRGHCVGPAFISDQLARSLRNLGVAQVDLYYLHNPELAREALGNQAFWHLLAETFAVLEDARSSGLLGSYGLAMWNGPIVDATHAQHVALADAVELARRVGGASHGFKAVQLPLNVGKREAFVKPTQLVGGHRLPAVEAAKQLGLSVFSSASVLQGAEPSTDVQRRLGTIPGMPSRTAAALQFTRSVPGVTSALVGMRRIAHVREALELARRPLLSKDVVDRLAQ